MRKLVLITTLTIFITFCLGILATSGQEGRGAEAEQPAVNMVRLLMRLMDLDNDDQLSGREYMKLFIDADQDMDRAVTQEQMTEFLKTKWQEIPDQVKEQGSGTQQPDANMGRLLIRLMDTNNDKQIAQSEYMKLFVDADLDKSRSVTRKEMMEFLSKRRQLEQEADGPDVGQEAPDFTLGTLDGKGTITLSDFRGKKPVVLVFGSYT